MNGVFGMRFYEKITRKMKEYNHVNNLYETFFVSSYIEYNYFLQIRMYQKVMC